MCSFVMTTVAGAQVGRPGVTMFGNPRTPRPVSAAEAAYFVAAREARLRDAISIQRSAYPEDSLHAAVALAASAWVQRMQGTLVRGLQLDPYGALSVTAGDLTRARQLVAERLATPGLSLDARAYTYLTAIEALVVGTVPARMTAAEEYLGALNALGAPAAYWRHMAHRVLGGAYYLLGRPDDVVRHGTNAIELLPVMPYIHRLDTGMSGDAQYYSEVIDALAGRPNGVVRIRTLNTLLSSVWTPPAELVQRDSIFVQLGATARDDAARMVTTAMRIGTTAHDIVGPTWVNLPGGPSVLSVRDGRIHVFELGHYSCPPCQQAMVTLQRVQDKFPDIRVVNATATEGTWGYRLVSPDTEVVKLAAYYTEQLKIRFPITIWPGPLRSSEDGGMLPESDGPNFENYPMAGKPNIYVIDGRGIIRRVFVGALTREREAQLVRLIEFLRRAQVEP
jgi:thiol-disulfide isomerase/thioredoxin